MPLTPRQRDVVTLLAAGCSYRQIAERLTITPRTVRQHVEDVAGRLPSPHPPGCAPKCRVLHAAERLLAA